jgi:hypothetical protein
VLRRGGRGWPARCSADLRQADDTDADENVQIVIVDGKAYKIPLASTKMYQRELRRFGGLVAREMPAEPYSDDGGDGAEPG